MSDSQLQCILNGTCKTSRNEISIIWRGLNVSSSKSYFLSVIWNILQLICSEVLNIKDYPINIKKYKSKPLEDIYDGNIYIMFIDEK